MPARWHYGGSCNKAKRGNAIAAVESDALSYQVVGKRPTRPDGVEKVTGRARYGADAFAPGMLIDKVLRSPYPHARVRSIDASKALALPGVKAVVTRADFADVSDDPPMHDTLCNLMAGDKVLYEGHAVAAVAVDGQIYNGARFQPIPEGAKVFLLPKLTGG